MQHQQLSSGKWNELSFVEQMAHIGSEVERMIKWREKNQPKFVNHALVRALELIDLTTQQHVDEGSKTQGLRQKLKECLIDYFVYSNPALTIKVGKNTFAPSIMRARMNRR